MKIKNLLISFLVICFMASIAAAPALAAKMGLIGKGKMANAEEIAPSINIPVLPPRGKAIGRVNPDPGYIKTPSGIPALPGASEIWIYPRCTTEAVIATTDVGTYQGYRDAVNIQWAVDNVAVNGTVRLMVGKGKTERAFYFGEPGPNAGYIEIQTEGVKIIGNKQGSTPGKDWAESDLSNQEFQLPNGTTIKSDRATIYGGGNGYSNGVIAAFISDPYDFTVQGIRFENSGTAIYAAASGTNGITLDDNVITNIFPSPNTNYGFLLVANASGIIKGDTYITNNKIIINNSNYDGVANGILTQYAGKLHVNYNSVTGNANPMRRNYGYYLVAVDAYSEITSNEVSLNGAYYGLACGTNGAGEGKHKIVKYNRVTGNDVTMGLVLMALNSSEVKYNTVNVALNPLNDTLPGALKTGAFAAVLSSAKGSTIEKNNFRSTHDPNTGNQAYPYASIGFGAFGPFGAVQGNILKDNTISGNGARAIGARQPSMFDTVIEGNNMTGFTVDPGPAAEVIGIGNAQGNIIRNNFYPASGTAPAIRLLSTSSFNTVNEPTLECTRITNLGTNNCVKAGGVSCTPLVCP